VSERESTIAGTRLGRYFVLGRIAEGGYGEVLRAYDPQLDRKVALKLLRPERTPAGTRRAALLREAQALAKLSHPAVVAVYEVFDGPDQTVLAMELVDGVELGQWLGDARHWSEGFDVVLAAGHGLVAAHAAGVVHGDFKPANLLVGADGRARVVDFGLADTAARDQLGSASDLGDDGETSDGQRAAGTPRYMAPELFAGASASAATDQYAFFVTLFEAIYGAPPFSGASADERLAAKRSGVLPFPPRPAVPTWLRAALARGLAVDPRQRPSALAEVIAELERCRRRRRSRGWLAIGAGLLGVALLVIPLSSSRTRACADAAEGFANGWDGSRRARVHAALTQVSPLLAEETLAILDPELQSYLDEWSVQYRRSCEAAPADAAPSDPQLRCLQRQRVVVQAWIDALGRASASTVERAVPAIAALPRPADCLAIASREGFAVAADPRVAREVETLRRAIDETATRADAGDASGALAQTDALIERGEALGDAAVIAEALRLRGALRASTGDPHGARTDLEAALWQAEAIAHDALVVRAAIDLTADLGVTLELPAEARVFARHGRAMLERGPPQPALESELLARGAEVDALDQRFDAAEHGLREALELATLAHGPDHLALAELWIDLGNVATARGAYDEAEAPLQRGLEIRRAWLPAHHPAMASALHNVAVLAQQRGRFAAARSSLLEVLALEREAYGSSHPKLAITITNLASAELALERYDDAEAHARAALDILEHSVGPEHPNLGLVRVNLGQIRFAAGDTVGALAYTQEGIAQLERVRSPTHASLVQPLHDLAMIHRERGELDQARAAIERARAIDLGGDDDDDTLWAWYAMRIAALDAYAGDATAAIAGYETALAAMTIEREPHALELLETELGLAAIWHAQGDDAAAQRWALAAAEGQASGSAELALVVGEAHELLAELARGRGDLEQAESHARAVLDALDPESRDAPPSMVPLLARLALARGLWYRGRHRDARAQLEPQLRATCSEVASDACRRAREWAAQRWSSAR
jgi:eukaryotic-like serine/threonine-protein kinase